MMAHGARFATIDRGGKLSRLFPASSSTRGGRMQRIGMHPAVLGEPIAAPTGGLRPRYPNILSHNYLEAEFAPLRSTTVARRLPFLNPASLHGSRQAQVSDPERDGATLGRRVLLFFIDGIGVGGDDPDANPLATGEFPTLRLTKSLRPDSPSGPPAMAHGLDASLGVPGLPQSATGQTSILTGVNAPAAMGRHISGFPGPALRKILLEHSILKVLREAGLDATFLNAFGPRFFETPETARRLSATTVATLASGARFRDWTDLVAGRAVVHDLTHWRMREWGFDLELRTPEEAGAIIAREAARADFSLFE